MNHFIRISIAALLLSLIALAQNPAKTNRTRPATAKKIVALSGAIGDDGLTLVNNEINVWTITNPSSLKGYEGEYVTVRCRLDPDKHSMHVISVEAQPLVKASLGDSAFRR